VYSALVIQRIRDGQCRASPGVPATSRLHSRLVNTTPPDEKTVREVLLRALRASGLDPLDGWVSVRAVNSPWPLQRSYTVVIAYQPARAALAGMLRRNTSGAEKEAVGVWVLNESEARQLCGGASDGA
jgi:hypothetical protein